MLHQRHKEATPVRLHHRLPLAQVAVDAQLGPVQVDVHVPSRKSHDTPHSITTSHLARTALRLCLKYSGCATPSSPRDMPDRYTGTASSSTAEMSAQVSAGCSMLCEPTSTASGLRCFLAVTYLAASASSMTHSVLEVQIQQVGL